MPRVAAITVEGGGSFIKGQEAYPTVGGSMTAEVLPMSLPVSPIVEIGTFGQFPKDGSKAFSSFATKLGVEIKPIPIGLPLSPHFGIQLTGGARWDFNGANKPSVPVFEGSLAVHALFFPTPLGPTIEVSCHSQSNRMEQGCALTTGVMVGF